MSRNPSHRTYERRWKEHARSLAEAERYSPDKLQARIFVGVYPCGLVYADREREVGGDYARLAFLPFRSLGLEFEAATPRLMREWIRAHAAPIQARRGEEFQVSTCGQTVLLGSVPNA